MMCPYACNGLDECSNIAQEKMRRRVIEKENQDLKDSVTILEKKAEDLRGKNTLLAAECSMIRAEKIELQKKFEARGNMISEYICEKAELKKKYEEKLKERNIKAIDRNNQIEILKATCKFKDREIESLKKKLEEQMGLIKDKDEELKRFRDDESKDEKTEPVSTLSGGLYVKRSDGWTFCMDVTEVKTFEKEPEAKHEFSFGDVVRREDHFTPLIYIGKTNICNKAVRLCYNMNLRRVITVYSDMTKDWRYEGKKEFVPSEYYFDYSSKFHFRDEVMIMGKHYNSNLPVSIYVMEENGYYILFDPSDSSLFKVNKEYYDLYHTGRYYYFK